MQIIIIWHKLGKRNHLATVDQLEWAIIKSKRRIYNTQKRGKRRPKYLLR